MNKNTIGPAIDLIGLELWKVLKPVIVGGGDDEGTNELAQFLADFRPEESGEADAASVEAWEVFHRNSC